MFGKQRLRRIKNGLPAFNGPALTRLGAWRQNCRIAGFGVRHRYPLSGSSQV
jgi:hypothetical protein